MCLTCNAPPLTPSTLLSCTGQPLTQWTGNAHGTHLEHLSAGPLFCTWAGKGSKENSILLFKIGRLLGGLDMRWQRGCPSSALFLSLLTCSPFSLAPPDDTPWRTQFYPMDAANCWPYHLFCEALYGNRSLTHFSLLASLLSHSEVQG